MVHGYSLGSFHADAPVARNRCGTFLELRYLRIAMLGGVPSVWNVNNTFSSSTSLRTCSTAFGGLYPSSRLTRLIFRPLIPPWSLIILKYAASTRPMVP